ncbi:MAG: VWA domain-containing protein [Pseudomonadota bacterium]
MTGNALALPFDDTWTQITTLDRAVVETHGKLSALIDTRLGQVDAALLAEPVFDDRGRPIAWRSRRGGDLKPLNQQPDREARRASLEAAIGRVLALADALEAQGDAGRIAAHSLRAAMVTPQGTDSAYVDGDAVVLVQWGLAARGQTVPLVTDAPAADAPAGTAARQQGHWLYSAAWLLPAGLLCLCLYLFWQAMQPPPVQTVEVTPPAPPSVDPTLGLRDRIIALDEARDAALAFHARLAAVCRPVPEQDLLRRVPAPETAEPADERGDLEPREPPPQSAEAREEQPSETAEAKTEDKPDAPETPAAEPELPEDADLDGAETQPTQDPAVAVLSPQESPVPLPYPGRKPAGLIVRKPTAGEDEVAGRPEGTGVDPGNVAIAPAPAPSAPVGSACTPTWPPGRSPRVLFVVDGSGSMRDGIPGARSRLDAAKSSISRTVRSLHKDIRIGTVSFSNCGATRHSKFYSAAERGSLLREVNAMRPGSATSLAASIRRAGAAAPRRSESIIVVVSDGQDTCGGDPCSVAQQIVRQKPNVRINVVDLSGRRASNELRCVARAGRGQVFSPANASDMAGKIQRATGHPDASGCG